MTAPTPPEPDPGPLSGVKILDLTRVLAGPFATSVLCDLGATVIKVEDPTSGDISRQSPPFVDGWGTHFVNLNRDKQSVGINLKSPEGNAIVLDLIRQADVLVENFRPGVMARLGLDYDTVSAANPRIIYCSISGYGQTSSWANRPSFDVLTQAMSGAMSVTGEPGRPPVRLGIPMGDLAGGIYAAFGVLAALHERSSTGVGRQIDISMLDGLLHLMLYYPLDYLNVGTVAAPVGGRHEHTAPYGRFTASDGHLVLAMFGSKFWELYCHAVGREDLVVDKRFATARLRLRNKADLYAILDELMKERAVEEWGRLFDDHGIPWAPILTSAQVAEHELAAEREMFVKVQQPGTDGVYVAGHAVKFPGRASRPIGPAPALSQHTSSVLMEMLGLDEEAIEELHSKSVIGLLE